MEYSLQSVTTRRGPPYQVRPDGLLSDPRTILIQWYPVVGPEGSVPLIIRGCNAELYAKMLENLQFCVLLGGKAVLLLTTVTWREMSSATGNPRLVRDSEEGRPS